MSPLCLVSIALLVSTDASRTAVSTRLSPIGKVVKLVEEMRAQTEKDADADKTNYDKYMCWCTTNGAQKEGAIAEAGKQINELTTFVQEAAAKEGELKTDIGTLTKDIEDDKDALASATEVRTKEAKEFEVESADLTETSDLLGKSVNILAKVQLVQTPVSKQEAAVLLQTHHKVTRKHPNFIKALEKDLFDVLGSMPTEDQASFTQEDQPQGAAAGAKSYNSQSGQIVGVLGGMKDKAESDLAAANKAEESATLQFGKLKQAKVNEIATSTDEMEKKKADLADTMDKAAKAKEDIAALEETKAADEQFLANLKKNCANEDAEYQKRLKIRSEEIRALGETLKILTDNDARELFGKTISFMQVEQQSKVAKARAMQKITSLAKHNGNIGLLALALKGRVSNSKFDEVVKMVKAAMDKMIAQMKAQREEEARKIAACKNGLTEVEEQLADAQEVKANLDEQHANIKNGIEKLSSEIDGLKKEIEDMKVSLKQASEARKAENLAFQTAINDNRATIMILNKALTRLKQFYQPKSAALIEVQAHQPAPPSSTGYSKSSGAGGVLQLLHEIITEAEQEGIELDADEKHAQARYAELVTDTKESIEAASLAIQEKGVAMTKLEGDKSETEESQLANSQEIESFEKTLAAHHLDCDFLLKWGPMRQAALEEEMDSTQDAEATLAGADMK